VESLSREQLAERGRTASQVAADAVALERRRYKQRQMEKPQSAKVLRMLHCLGDQRQDIVSHVGPQIKELKQAMYRRYNTLFGALSANVNGNYFSKVLCI